MEHTKVGVKYKAPINPNANTAVLMEQNTAVLMEQTIYLFARAVIPNGTTVIRNHDPVFANESFFTDIRVGSIKLLESIPVPTLPNSNGIPCVWPSPWPWVEGELYTEYVFGPEYKRYGDYTNGVRVWAIVPKPDQSQSTTKDQQQKKNKTKQLWTQHLISILLAIWINPKNNNIVFVKSCFGSKWNCTGGWFFKPRQIIFE